MEFEQLQIDDVSKNNVFTAGRLKFFIQEWEKLTSDPYILNIVHQCELEFKDNILPVQNSKSIRNTKVNSKQELVIEAELQKLLKMNAIEETQSEDGEFISPIFVTTKKNGEYRMILNLKGLNEYIEYHHFKMDTFETALNLIKPNCLMASADLRHAYHSVSIDEQYRKYLRFKWKDKLFQYTCLPFGISCAPRLFTKIMKVPYSVLRKQGYVNVGYIDDSLLLGDTIQECNENITETVNMFTKLGFIINEEKSVLKPQKKILFLGFWIDSENMIVTLPTEKVEKLKKEITHLLKQKCTTIREVSKILGLIISTFPAVETGNLFYRDIESEKIEALKSAKGNFDGLINITPTIIKELEWWVTNLHTQVRHIDRINPQIIIKSDASLIGWGAIVQNDTSSETYAETGGRWTDIEKLNHINYLEILAIFHALKSFTVYLKNIEHVKILTDNTTAVSYINNKGGIKSKKCNEIAKIIWMWCIKQNIWLTATHIPGNDNIEADRKSRKFNDHIEWQLNVDKFNKICKLWGRPEIDLFASRLNKQVHKFCSWTLDPESTFVDAFTINWGSFYCYLFPPFSLLAQCIKKIERDKAEAIVVAPLWPTQVWFARMLQMLVNSPIVIKAADNLLTLPYKEMKHPLRKTLNLMVCRISGETTKSKEFLETQPIYYSHHGESELKNSTVDTLRNGFCTVVKNKLIKFKFL